MELNAEDQRVIPIPCPHRDSLHPQLLPSICVHLRCGFIWCIQFSVRSLVLKKNFSAEVDKSARASVRACVRACVLMYAC